MKEEFDISVVFPPAMMGYKRRSDEAATTNNLSKWWKQSKTRIKGDFKNMIKEWYLPIWDRNIYRSAEIHFTILRTNQRRMDSDSLGPSTYKWAIDCLTEQGYIIDDDQCKVVLNPTLLGQSGNVETMIRMEIKLLERKEMTIEELKKVVKILDSELTMVHGKKHVKASSKRAQDLLNEITNAAPQLKQDLIDASK